MKIEEEKEKIRKTWLNHEENINSNIKLICQENNIKFIEKNEWPYNKQPDNVIKICDEFIIFDA